MKFKKKNLNEKILTEELLVSNKDPIESELQSIIEVSNLLSVNDPSR